MSNKLMQEALSKMGYNARYQKMLLVFLAITWFQITYLLLGCPFVFMNPLFKCSFSDDLVEEDVACRSLDQCQIENDYTITAYAGLYCDKQTDRALIQSFLYMGSVIGLFVMNVVSDTKGRKFSFMIAMITATIGILINIIGAYSHAVWMMAAAQMMCGFGGYSSMIIGYIIISDLCQDELKGYGIIAMNGFWGIAEISYVIYYYLMPEWYNYLILVQFIPIIGILIVFSFFVPETPIYLALKARDKARCMQSLAHIGMFNGKGASQLREAQILVDQAIAFVQNNQHEEAEQSPILTLLKNKFFLRTILMIAIMEIGTNMYYYCIQFSLDDLGFNFGIDILLAGTAETLGYFCISTHFKDIDLFINKVKRRQGLLVVNIASFIFGVLYAFDFISKNLIVASIFICLCRFVNSKLFIDSAFSQGFIPLLQTQSFPEKVQSSGAGVIEGISQLGSFATPYLMTGLLNAGQKPIIYFALIVLIVGIVPLKFIKQTLIVKEKKDLSQSFISDEEKPRDETIAS